MYSKLISFVVRIKPPSVVVAHAQNAPLLCNSSRSVALAKRIVAVGTRMIQLRIDFKRELGESASMQTFCILSTRKFSLKLSVVLQTVFLLLRMNLPCIIVERIRFLFHFSSSVEMLRRQSCGQMKTRPRMYSTRSLIWFSRIDLTKVKEILS